MDFHPAGRVAPAAVALAASFSLLVSACGTGPTAPAPTAAPSTSAPVGGLPGAVERADDVKDQTNARTRELEDQVSTYGK